MADSPSLHLLPTRTGGAAENMALDFLLLQRYPGAGTARFRHYEWRGPACTFGYSQKFEWVRGNLPPGGPLDLCRRPTGGGIVDHRDDWTYSLVIPRGHALFEAKAAVSYRVVHECLAEALAVSGRPAEVKQECNEVGGVGPDASSGEASCGQGAPPEGICFRRAERYDVINPRTGAKIAGAAQKRNKNGLLIQGSVDRGAAGPLDWDAFGVRFAAALGGALGVAVAETGWPDLGEDEVGGLIEHYSSPGWLEYR